MCVEFVVRVAVESRTGEREFVVYWARGLQLFRVVFAIYGDLVRNGGHSSLRYSESVSELVQITDTRNSAQKMRRDDQNVHTETNKGHGDVGTHGVVMR